MYLAAALALALGAAAQGAPPDPRTPVDLVQQLLSAYISDPVGMRPRLLEFARGGLDGVPPVLLLAVTDALLRDGQPHAARTVLETLTVRGAPPEWAEKGLAWVALVSGNLAEARDRYARLAQDSPDPSATVIVALIDAAGGRMSAAVGVLADVAANAQAPAILRQVAQLGTAYAFLWGRDYANAERSFTAAADDHARSRLTDDARYGAALARFRRGDADGAAAALEELAGPGRGPARASRELLSLRPGAILRAGRRHFSRAPFMVQADAIAALLDVNGTTLARAALRRTAAKSEPPAGAAATAPTDQGLEPTPEPASADEAGRHTRAGGPTPPMGRGASSPAGEPETPGARGRDPWVWILGAVVLAVIGALAWRRRADRHLMSPRR